MKKLFFGNFDFEHDLAQSPGWKPPETIRRLNAELACVWMAVAEKGDYLWTPQRIDSEFFDLMFEYGFPSVRPVCEESEIREPVEVIPWGWTVEVRNWAAKQGWVVNAPPQRSVREANSRFFSTQLEQEWKIGLEGTAFVDSLEALSAALQMLPRGCDRWVLKAEFSMSARERITGKGRKVSDQTANWARKRIAQNGAVILEPWVHREQEAGLQFTIPKQGPVVFEGLTPLLTDENGGYLGSRFDRDPQTRGVWDDAVEIGQKAAERLQNSYTGPLGIDAVQYHDYDGTLRMRPLQDINARYTMGRLALGFRRWLDEGECGTWLHLNWPDFAGEKWMNRYRECERNLPTGARLICTSPREVDLKTTRHGTVVLISSSREDLEKAEHIYRECFSGDA